MSAEILRIENLKTYFSQSLTWPTEKGLSLGERVRRSFYRRQVQVKAVDGVSFSIREGETLGLVGESGCGKSTLGRTILRLLKPTEGHIHFRGQDITHLSQASLRPVRRHMQMIFQDPYASLNPRMTVGSIIAEPLHIYSLVKTQAERALRVTSLLAKVGLPSDAASRFVHEFSGGQRQRIGIARALALAPQFIICDEPVSALDVSIQAQIINLLQALQKTEELTYLFISHDLKVVKHLCDRVMVMYLGKIVEISDTKSLYSTPLHPYTKALLSAVPNTNPNNKKQRILLEGDVPSPIDPPKGCPFHPRCPQKNKPDKCSQIQPEVTEFSPGHWTACHVVQEARPAMSEE